MGQAYCLRAFTYFWIIRIWGDAPLVTAPYLDSNDSFDLPKAAVADIVEQIHSDLENASNMIDKNSTSRTTFTQTAAYAINAHVYAWEHKYEETINMADKVLTNTNYTLANLYDENIPVRQTMSKTKISKHWYKPANMHKSLIPDAVKNRF